MHYRQWEVKLSHGDSHTLNNHANVPFVHILEINVVLEIQGHIVVSGDEHIDKH